MAGIGKVARHVVKSSRMLFSRPGVLEELAKEQSPICVLIPPNSDCELTIRVTNTKDCQKRGHMTSRNGSERRRKSTIMSMKPSRMTENGTARKSKCYSDAEEAVMDTEYEGERAAGRKSKCCCDGEEAVMDTEYED